MEKTENVSKSLVLLLKEDTIKDEDLKASIQALDDKVKRMLSLSTICSVWGYLVFIVVIARLYASFHGKHSFWLISSLAAMYVLMGIFIWYVWKNIVGKRSYFHLRSGSYFNYQSGRLSGQFKLIILYLLEYGMLLSIAGAFFLSDVPDGLAMLLRLTTPVTVITYTLGIYFLVSFAKQIKKFEVMNDQVNHAIYIKNIGQN